MIVTAEITRDQLALDPLEINDHMNYRLVSFGGSTMTWERQEATSPWIDGAITISRRRGKPQETIVVDVVGTSHVDLVTKVRALIQAFVQDSFLVTFTLDSQDYTWECETADYAVNTESVWMHNMRSVVTFNVPRRPIPVAGSF